MADTRALYLNSLHAVFGRRGIIHSKLKSSEKCSKYSHIEQQTTMYSYGGCAIGSSNAALLTDVSRRGQQDLLVLLQDQHINQNICRDLYVSVQAHKVKFSRLRSSRARPEWYSSLKFQNTGLRLYLGHWTPFEMICACGEESQTKIWLLVSPNENIKRLKSISFSIRA